MSIFQEISNSVRKGNSRVTKELVSRALNESIAAFDILNEGILPGIDEISVLFKNNQVYVPEVLVSANAAHNGIELLKPHFEDSAAPNRGRVVIGTVKGDLHDIGKNVVGIMLEVAGFQIFDIGANAGPELFCDKAKEVDADIIALSALLTTTMPMMNKIVKAVQECGLRNRVKILIGGAPITERFAKLIQADAYAENASQAVDAAKKLIGERTVQGVS